MRTARERGCLKAPRSRSNAFSSASRSRRTWRTTSASPVSPGLAVLSSDALSSVAYATDFILATLVVAGVGAFVYAVPISLVIATLLAIVAFSYRQTIHAYPTGGGAYIVAKENIGPTAGSDRRRVAARGLHADRRGQHLGRRPRHHVGVSRARRRIASRCVSRSSRS